ncbi:hypothetical protein D3C72_2499340 [compost metagenome]
MCAAAGARFRDAQHDVEFLRIRAASASGKNDTVNVVTEELDQLLLRQAVHRSDPC